LFPNAFLNSPSNGNRQIHRTQGLEPCRRHGGCELTCDRQSHLNYSHGPLVKTDDVVHDPVNISSQLSCGLVQRAVRPVGHDTAFMDSKARGTKIMALKRLAEKSSTLRFGVHIHKELRQ